MFRPGASFLAFALAASVAGPAGAADDVPPPRGYLTAFVCGATATPLRLRVELADNATQNLPLKDLLVQRLAKNGARIADTAQQVLSLEIAIERQATRTKGGDMIDVRVGGERPEAGESDFARVRMNIWSSSRDSLLAGRRSAIEQHGFDLLRLRASLNSRTDGRCLWRGEIVEDLDGDDPYRVAAKLVPDLADAVGKAVGRKPVD